MNGPPQDLAANTRGGMDDGQPGVSLAAAEAAVHAIRSQAIERGLRVTVAVVDAGATLKMLQRMDGTYLVSVELAVGKATTAARTGRATHEWNELLTSDPNLRWAATTSIEGLVIFGGGIVVKSGHDVIGGIGVSGASQEQDQELAELGLSALLAELDRFESGSTR